MKPLYRKTSYGAPGRIVTILLFVITFMSFALNSVPAQCAGIFYDILTLLDGCWGCDLTSHPPGELSVPVASLPLAAITIESYANGSYTLPDAQYPFWYGTITSSEYSKASAVAFPGLIGLSVSSSASLSPSSIEVCGSMGCLETNTPTRAGSSAVAQIGFKDVLNVMKPGVPTGTPVNLKMTKVWEGELNTTNPLLQVYLRIVTQDPCDSGYDTDTYYGAGHFKDGHTLYLSIPNGHSCPFYTSLSGSSQSLAGWVLNQGTGWLPSHSSSVTAMNTFAYYIDVLTPGASYWTDSGTIYPTSDSVHLDINPTGTGSGSIKSSPSGIDCGPTCSAYYPPGSTVMLTATPAADGSIFSGWSDNPDCTDGSVFMATTKSCTGTFDLCPGTTRASVGSTNYDSIGLAYGGAATNGDTIKVLASNQQEGPIDFHSGKSVALIGGYDCLLNNIVSYTVVTGSITISTGDVTIANIHIR